jgi:hypothetical protein
MMLSFEMPSSCKGTKEVVEVGQTKEQGSGKEGPAAQGRTHLLAADRADGLRLADVDLVVGVVVGTALVDNGVRVGSGLGRVAKSGSARRREKGRSRSAMGGELADKALLAWRAGCPNAPLRHG